MALSAEEKMLRTEAQKAAFYAALEAGTSGKGSPTLAAHKASQAVIEAAKPKDWVAETVKQINQETTTAKQKYGTPTTADDIISTTKAMARDQKSSAKARAAAAEKAHQDYLQSDEYQQKHAEQEKKFQQDMFAQQLLTGIVNPPTPAPIVDEKEAQLRAMAQQLRAEADAEDNAAVMKKDVLDIHRMDTEDRDALEQYAVNQVRDQNLPVELVGMLPTAQQEAAGLIEKYGKQRTDELAETFMRGENQQLTAEVEEKARQQANENGFISSLATIPVNAVSGLIGTVGQLQGMARNTGRYSTLDPNATGTIGQTYSGAVRSQVQQNIEGEDPNFWRKAASIGYQGIMSMADTIARGFLGGGALGGAALAATNSFSQTMADASKNGATPGQAALLATATAGIEALTEKIPLDNLIDAAKGGKQTVGTIIKNALLQAGIEATTEEISLVGSLLAEAAILQDNSEYQQAVNEQLVQGKTLADAKRVANGNLFMEVVNTALVSMVSGGVSSGTAGIMANVQVNTKDTAPTKNKTTEQIKQETLAKVRTADGGQQILEATGEQPAQQMPEPEPRAPLTEDQKHIDFVQTAYINKKTGSIATPESVQADSFTSETPGGTAPNTDNINKNSTEVNGNPAKNPPVADTQNQSTQSGQVKGTGAAEQNFSGKAAYQELLSDENSQRERPGDVRPMEVPKTDSYGRRVSELVANAYGAEITTDKMANTIEELVQEGALGFDRRSNQESLNNAAAEIERKGVATTRKQITNAVANSKIKDGDIEQAILLYAMYNSKDTDSAQDNASEILVDLATMANITGRNLQMFRLLRKLTPEGQVSTIRKTVQKNIDQMIQSGAVKKGYSTEIDSEMLDEYRKAAKENMRAVSLEQKKSSEEKMKTIMDGIYAMEASKMPSTFKAKWDAWRYMAMLGNAKTQVRNVIGNLYFVPYKEVKDRTAALFEKVFVSKDQRTKSLTTDPELLAWARSDRESQAVRDALKYSAKLGDDVTTDKFREKMKVFKSDALDSVRKFVESVPAAGDMLFKNGYYARSLADFVRARGYSAADIQSGKVSDTVLTEARSYAIQEAMKATFNDCNAFSDFMATGLRYKGDNPAGKALNIAAEGILPFRRTPANIVVRFTEYSPVGLAKGVWDMATKVRKGDISAAAAVDQIGAGLTGSAAMALGYFLASGIAGVKITGSGTGEDEKRQGHQDYALEFSADGQEYSYKIDWAAPANLPLFVGANISKMLQDTGAETDVSKFTSVLHGMGTMFEPMLALSCMSSFNDLVEGIRYAPEGEALYTAAADIATSYFTQGIPALLRQGYQATQVNKQTTFANSADPTIRDLQKTAANIPFVGAEYQTDKLNAWGEPETQDNWMIRAFNAFVNPGTTKKIDNSALEKEITRLNGVQSTNVTPPTAPKTASYTDKNGDYHDNIRLTEEQYQTLARTQGQTAKRIVTDIISDGNYKSMTDEQKAKAIDLAYSFAKEKAEVTTFKDHTGLSQSWMLDLEENKEAAYIIRRVTNSELSNAMSALDTAWDKGYDESSQSKALDTAYTTYSEMSDTTKEEVREFATGTAAKYIEARDKGISHEDFLSAAENVAKVTGTGSNGAVRDIDRRQAIAETSGLSVDVVDTIMKAYMGDYDPDAETKEYTELKYDYIREALGLSPAEYAKTYRAHLDNSKKAEKIAAIMALGYDWGTAYKLYNVYASNTQGKNAYMKHYEKSQ